MKNVYLLDIRPLSLSYRPTMDPHAMEVWSNGERFATLMWHNGVPRVSLREEAAVGLRADVLAILADEATRLAGSKR